jgi:putative Mn2+ efflux pump MntP
MTITLSCAIINPVSDVGFITILITAVGLSADCFAVALSLSISQRGLSFRQFIRFPLAFGLFQAIMLVIGWLVGRSVVQFISAYDHWLAFGLLAVIGGRMIWESVHDKEETRTQKDINRLFTLMALAVATSIDSLAAGLSYAFLHVDIALAGVTTGLTTFIITIIGHFIGNRVGPLAGKWAEASGGVILILIGLRILLEHLL